MAAKFTKGDYQYIHKLARECGGEEKKRQQEFIEFRDKQYAKKKAQQEATALRVKA